MINSYRELLERTLDAYGSATKLSKDANFCLYSDKNNQVGCGIGCHLPAALCLALDELGQSNIMVVLDTEPQLAARIRQHLNVDAIGKANLVELQVAHDTSRTVGTFRAWLRTELSFVQKGDTDELPKLQHPSNWKQGDLRSYQDGDSFLRVGQDRSDHTAYN